MSKGVAQRHTHRYCKNRGLAWESWREKSSENVIGT